MLREFEENISEDEVHDFPICLELSLAGRDEYLVDESIGELH